MWASVYTGMDTKPYISRNVHAPARFGLGGSQPELPRGSSWPPNIAEACPIFNPNPQIFQQVIK